MKPSSRTCLPQSLYDEQLQMQRGILDSSPRGAAVAQCEDAGPPSSFEEYYVGRALQGRHNQYHIKPSCLDDGNLVVCPAISQGDGALCEAQFFFLRGRELPHKLYLSRKRRIQRLRRSANLLDEFDGDGVRILVSRVPRCTSRTCRRCRLALQHQHPTEEEAATTTPTTLRRDNSYSYNCNYDGTWQEEFPPLRRAKNTGDLPSDSRCPKPRSANSSCTSVASSHVN